MIDSSHVTDESKKQRFAESDLRQKNVSMKKNDQDNTKKYTNLIELSNNMIKSNNPEDQYNALLGFQAINTEFGLYPESFDLEILPLLIEYAFGNHDSQKVHDSAAELLESMFYTAQWTIPHFLDLNILETIYLALINRTTSLPPQNLAYALNSLISLNEEIYHEVIDLGYMKFILNSLIHPPKNELYDLIWQIISLQTILCSQWFIYPEIIPDALSIVISIVDHFDDVNVLAPTFAIASFLLTTQTESGMLKSIMANDFILKAIEIYNPEQIFLANSILDYFCNLVCYSSDFGTKLIEIGVHQDMMENFEQLSNEIKGKILIVLSNIAFEPVESTIEILNCGILDKTKDLIRNSTMALKAETLDLLLKLIVKAPFEMIIPYINSLNLFDLLTELLCCDDNDIIMKDLQCITFLVNKGETLCEADKKIIDNAIDDNVQERLIDLLDFPNPTISGIVANVIKTIEIIKASRSEDK